jgi:hypothetical protein
MPNEPTNRVLVSDVNMPFLSMVRFMVKWAIASIPAFLMLVLLGALCWVGLLSFGSVLGSGLSREAKDNPTTTNPSPNAATSLPAGDPALTAYFSKVIIRKVSVSKTTLGDDGVFGEVKNTGDRTLSKVEITIYCQDSEGKIVFEKQFRPVLVSDFSFGDSNQPLKPGYSRQFGVRLDDAPSDWSKKVDVKVTAIQFE